MPAASRRSCVLWRVGDCADKDAESSANGIMDETCMVEVVGTAVVSPAKRLDLSTEFLHIRRL